MMIGPMVLLFCFFTPQYHECCELGVGNNNVYIRARNCILSAKVL